MMAATAEVFWVSKRGLETRGKNNTARIHSIGKQRFVDPA
jgi:hypothetical protein